jgi:hypothetical protein
VKHIPIQPLSMWTVQDSSERSKSSTAVPLEKAINLHFSKSKLFELTPHSGSTSYEARNFCECENSFELLGGEVTSLKRGYSGFQALNDDIGDRLILHRTGDMMIKRC